MFRQRLLAVSCGNTPLLFRPRHNNCKEKAATPVKLTECDQTPIVDSGHITENIAHHPDCIELAAAFDKQLNTGVENLTATVI